MDKKELIEIFCKITNMVSTNLRDVICFDESTMTNRKSFEFLVADCFCDKRGKDWNEYNRVDDIVIEFIKKAAEDKIEELDIKNKVFFDDIK